MYDFTELKKYSPLTTRQKVRELPPTHHALSHRQQTPIEARPALSSVALADMATDQKQVPAPAAQHYKGFVAGVFSGIAKLTGKFIRFRLSHIPPHSAFRIRAGPGVGVVRAAHRIGIGV
ncbi:hypothetical protein F5B21DRAFT_389989 [Xylaria acuta]|nr:hypothetical protein F5B21DRAFT_389989 [Xylaria acuta]